MKNILFILAPTNFRDEEYFDTLQVIQSAGYGHKVASINPIECISKFGKTVAVDTPLDQANPDQFDAIVFVGGTGSEIYFQDKTAHNLANTFYSNHKVVAAICFGPRIIAEVGLLKDKKFTCSPGQLEQIKSLGGIFYNSPTIRDGNIITGNGPLAATEFGKLIVEVLEENDQT